MEAAWPGHPTCKQPGDLMRHTQGCCCLSQFRPLQTPRDFHRPQVPCREDTTTSVLSSAGLLDLCGEEEEFLLVCKGWSSFQLLEKTDSSIVSVVGVLI